MADSQISVSVPTELSNLGNLAQQMISDLTAGKNWMAVLSGAMPVLFTEGVKIDELKAELKSPNVLPLAGLVLGGIAAKVIQSVASAKAAKALAAPAVAIAPQAGDSAQA